MRGKKKIATPRSVFRGTLNSQMTPKRARGGRQEAYIVKQTAWSELCSTWSLSQALSKLLLPGRYPQLPPQNAYPSDLFDSCETPRWPEAREWVQDGSRDKHFSLFTLTHWAPLGFCMSKWRVGSRSKSSSYVFVTAIHKCVSVWIVNKSLVNSI